MTMSNFVGCLDRQLGQFRTLQKCTYPTA